METKKRQQRKRQQQKMQKVQVLYVGHDKEYRANALWLFTNAIVLMEKEVMITFSIISFILRCACSFREPIMKFHKIKSQIYTYELALLWGENGIR